MRDVHRHVIPPPPPNRRGFLKFLTHFLGVIFAAILGAPAVAYLLDPRNKKAAKSDFKPVAKLSDLKIGEPKQAVIRDTRRDAWTLHPDDVIGRVWLIRRDEEKVDVYSTVCPHMGCSVNFKEDEKFFKCPCHNAAFDMQGEKEPLPGGNVAPRGMDTLAHELRPDPENPKDKVVWVEYKAYYAGKEEKIEKS